MTIAQVKGARKKGHNYRRKFGPKPVSASKAASRLRRVVEGQRAREQRKGQKGK